MNDDCHAAFVHAFNCITLYPDLVHMVEILRIADDRSGKLGEMSWITKGEELVLYISKTCVRVYVQLIAGRER